MCADFRYKRAELGTRQYCSDNVTLFLGYIVVSYCINTTFVVATPFSENLRFLKNFLSLKLYIQYYVVVVAKLKKLLRAQLCKREYISSMFMRHL